MIIDYETRGRVFLESKITCSIEYIKNSQYVTFYQGSDYIKLDKKQLTDLKLIIATLIEDIE